MAMVIWGLKGVFESLVCISEYFGGSLDDAAKFVVFAFWVFLVVVGFSIAFFCDAGWCLYKLVKKFVRAHCLKHKGADNKSDKSSPAEI